MTTKLLALVVATMFVNLDFQAQVQPKSAQPNRDGVVFAGVVFTGGYDTDPADHGRPVILIASALGVPPTVFRKAFSKVSPAPAGQEPDPGRVQRNKKALLSALSPYGVTNDSLDKVTDYYRYAQSRGEVWRRRPASAKAIIVDGRVTGFEIIDGGAGYTVPPTASVPGATIRIKATIAFTKNLSKNGSVTSLTSL